MVTDSKDNDVDADTNNSASITATRTTRLDVPCGCGSGGDVSGEEGGTTATVSYRLWDIDLLYDVSDAWTFQVNFMYKKFL